MSEQGHFVDNKTLKMFADRFKLMLGEDKISPESRALREKLINTGVWGSNTDIGDLKILYKALSGVNLEDAMAVSEASNKVANFFLFNSFAT